MLLTKQWEAAEEEHFQGKYTFISSPTIKRMTEIPPYSHSEPESTLVGGSHLSQEECGVSSLWLSVLIYQTYPTVLGHCQVLKSTLPSSVWFSFNVWCSFHSWPSHHHSQMRLSQTIKPACHCVAWFPSLRPPSCPAFYCVISASLIRCLLYLLKR